MQGLASRPATVRPVAPPRARAAPVLAVAKPSAAKRGGGGAVARQQATNKAAAQAEGKAAPEPGKPKRSSQYTTWQAMAQHASSTTSSAATSGFDESMM
ncbi:hypothetical protein Rsub_07444 [Raphidocelis subcapitata]|uniref:Uncharacterized protein n=1 Tax=Raphidocelis subcapitata TaxID=307507 RepID=A0A2V0PAL0_9CHLO|nr:hypothetical protein Rsub_07444 [Raphidocelis subcapitata]|eukprot:GBF94943.1 hypothetical protein Rsub_07444 [Raphidocelis subcapitata]